MPIMFIIIAHSLQQRNSPGYTMRFGILPTCEKHLQNDRIISLKGEAWANNTITPSFLILKCLYQSMRVGGRICMC